MLVPHFYLTIGLLITDKKVVVYSQQQDGDDTEILTEENGIWEIM
jgi:hypothetical protein